MSALTGIGKAILELNSEVSKMNGQLTSITVDSATYEKLSDCLFNEYNLPIIGLTICGVPVLIGEKQ